jgi:hypothetical protein
MSSGPETATTPETPSRQRETDSVTDKGRDREDPFNWPTPSEPAPRHGFGQAAPRKPPETVQKPETLRMGIARQ